MKLDPMKQKMPDQVKKPTKEDVMKKMDTDPKKMMMPTVDPKKFQ